MIEQQCPWCEATLGFELEQIAQDEAQTCPECLTTWLIEDEAAPDLALAA